MGNTGRQERGVAGSDEKTDGRLFPEPSEGEEEYGGVQFFFRGGRGDAGKPWQAT